MDQNPFNSWWFKAAYVFNPLARVFGFAVALQRCEWTKSRSRLTLAFVGW